MSEKIVSPETRLAAKRAAVKTAAQTARGAGAAVVVSLGTTLIGVDWLAVAATAGASVITVLWAAVDAYLDKIHNGIPAEYVDAGLAQAAVDDGF